MATIPGSASPQPSVDPPTSGASLTPAAAIGLALQQFSALTSKQPEGVSGVRAITGGWSVLVDVLELERIPDSTSVMAIYRIDLDGAGQLLSCERLRRYHRGATDLA